MYTTLWAAHPVYEEAIGTLDRPSWKRNPSLQESSQINIWEGSYGVSYVGSQNTTIYSRGHLVPNGDRNNIKEMQEQTFYATNSVPQIHDYFNGGIWNSLENAVRAELSSPSDTIYVVTGAMFNKEGVTEDIKYIQPKYDTKEVPVPNYFYKVVMRVKWSNGSVASASAIGFWFEHKQYPSGSSYANYVQSVDQIEKWTGFDFFVNLPDEVETAAEKNTSWTTFQNF